jgi:hypothetical protein
VSEQEKQPVDVAGLLAVFIDQLAGIAWAKLGLQPDPITGAIHPDMVQAKLAIDSTADLVKHLEPQLDDDDRRQLQNLVRDLRINYVNRS